MTGVLILNPLKAQEKQSFSGVFREYKIRASAKNRLISSFYK